MQIILHNDHDDSKEGFTKKFFKSDNFLTSLANILGWRFSMNFQII